MLFAFACLFAASLEEKGLNELRFIFGGLGLQIFQEFLGNLKHLTQRQ